MNTKRGALREGCSAFSAARAAATSGRSCSAACRVFFERDLVTIVEAPDRARSNLELLRAAEPQADVIKRQVRLRGDKIEQPLLMLVQRRAAMAGAGLVLNAAGVRPAPDTADRRRGTDVEQTCRLPRTVTLLDDRDDPHPQVFRVSLRHRAPPPLSLEEPNLICAPEGTPYDPSDSNQTESALEELRTLSIPLLRGRAGVGALPQNSTTIKVIKSNAARTNPPDRRHDAGPLNAGRLFK